jgi:hypothetical protein
MRLKKILFTLAAFAPPTMAAAQDGVSVERGRYIAVIGGCNDCHSTGWDVTAGNLPETEWLKGSSFGFRGPWGTTFAPNLRLSLAERTEDAWVEYARTFETRPPMPWYNVHAMSEEDLRSFHRFVAALPGGPGDPAPEFVPPGQEPAFPHAILAPYE